MPSQSRNLPSRRRPVLAALAAVLGLSVFPAAAQAHTGPANPIASSYKATIDSGPPGTVAKVLDADQRLRLSVSPAETLVVLDSQGAPYLRFSRAGVEVNRNSVMYFLNLPTPLTPPARLTRSTPPDWARAAFTPDYTWHDGRLHALASVALRPGSSYIGRWRIPLRVDGRPAAITGSLRHANDPSLVWFWPAVVVLVCFLAGWRLGRPKLDVWVARGLAATALVALTVGSLGRQLYGQPRVTTSQLIVLGLILAFVALAAAWLFAGRLGFLALLVIGLAAVGQAIEFIPVLLNGYVFTTLPAFVARAVAVACLCAGPGLILLAFHSGASPAQTRAADPAQAETAPI
jgi:hypothetical protein